MSYNWEYGNRVNPGKVKTYTFDKEEIKKVEQKANPFQYQRTAESFLNLLTQKKEQSTSNISEYKEGQRIYHKKFGEGTIQKLEQEGDDYKVDILFDKVGHKRLMAKFAGLQII